MGRQTSFWFSWLCFAILNFIDISLSFPSFCLSLISKVLKKLKGEKLKVSIWDLLKAKTSCCLFGVMHPPYSSTKVTAVAFWEPTAGQQRCQLLSTFLFPKTLKCLLPATFQQYWLAYVFFMTVLTRPRLLCNLATTTRVERLRLEPNCNSWCTFPVSAWVCPTIFVPALCSVPGVTWRRRATWSLPSETSRQVQERRQNIRAREQWFEQQHPENDPARLIRFSAS